jgi:hypothetical protein
VLKSSGRHGTGRCPQEYATFAPDAIDGWGMDRRRFLVCSCSLLASSSGVRDARAATGVEGCRKGASAGLGDIALRATSTRPFYDTFCRHWHGMLAADFGVRPGFSFFDDADWPNAYAESTPLSPDAPDGAVLLGIELLKREIGALGDQMAMAKVAAILAHEFAHICQFKRGITGPWQVELHADFLAGWALARQLSRLTPPPPPPGDLPILPPLISVFLHIFGNQSAVQTMFEKGDTHFENPGHHGTPEQRATMVMAGYGTKELNLSAAFARGLTVSGLQRPQ